MVDHYGQWSLCDRSNLLPLNRPLWPTTRKGLIKPITYMGKTPKEDIVTITNDLLDCLGIKVDPDTCPWDRPLSQKTLYVHTTP